MNREEKDICQEDLMAGDETVFSLLFNRYYSYLSAVAFQYVPDKQIVESISEDVLFILWEKRKEILPLTSIKSYLLKSVRNKSIDYLRSSANRYFENIDSSTCFIPDEELFEKYVLSELEKHIEEEINLLPKECRKVFCISRYEGMSYDEIALNLGISINTVKYHIKNAICILRKRLAPYLSLVMITYFQNL